mgnify:CR=1 FL=1
MWHYDNDLGGPASATLLAAQARREQNSDSLPEGVFSQRGSSTCILVEIKPSAVTDEFKASAMSCSGEEEEVDIEPTNTNGCSFHS